MSDVNNSFYRRSGLVKDTDRTYVPDLYRQCADELRAEEQHSTSPASRSYVLQSRPIVGVLFSISAGSDGELFPLYIGRNLIGRDEDSDVCLREGSVSGSHAILLARKQFNEVGEEEVTIAITDNNSSCGTRVNGIDISYEKVNCHHGDIITIGENYQLLLSLFNIADRLEVSPRFEHVPLPASEEKEAAEKNVTDRSTGPNVTEGVGKPASTHFEDEDDTDFYRPSLERKGDHYNNKTIII